jgi:parallel beta-helix repeat protein
LTTSHVAWLEVDSGPAQGQDFQLRGTMRIGRTLDNEITLHDTQISRHHAAISREAGGFTLQDLGSSNGTFLNDQRVTEPRILRDGDRIRVGNTNLVFCAVSTSPPPPQPPAPTSQPTMTAQWQSPPSGPPAPAEAKAGRRSGGLPVAIVVLGALLALLACAMAAIGLYLALGKPELSGRQTVPVAITQVVTGAPGEMVTVVVTSLPQATDIPLATPTPDLEPVTVRIAPDSGGDYKSLQVAVESVPPGSTLILEPGTHRLVGTLEITKSLNLLGAGMDETFVTGVEGDQIVLFRGPGTFTIEGITFRYEGDGWARAVTVDEAEIDILRCRFTGAVWSAEETRGGDGLLLWGNTTGSIRESRFEGNELHGIEFQDQAQPLLEGNVMTGNGENGVVYFEESGGIARNNDCSGNGLHGIGAAEDAGPTLEGNACNDNEQVGIRFSDSATGTARNNTCTGNGLHGISVSDEAEVTLEGNLCSDNQEIGIRFSESATGTVRNNTCTGNGLHGVSVNDEAQPVLEENVCNDNTEVGIRFTDSSEGVARANECSGNGLHGISVSRQAQLLLEENTCTNNVQVGIRFTDSSGGTVRGNRCSENGLHGLQLKEQARATLEGNIANNNTEAGLLFFDSAGGVARQNECLGNKWGIYVAETANPELVDNDCRENSAADVYDLR